MRLMIWIHSVIIEEVVVKKVDEVWQCLRSFHDLDSVLQWSKCNVVGHTCVLCDLWEWHAVLFGLQRLHVAL